MTTWSEKKNIEHLLEKVKLNMMTQTKTGDAYLNGTLDYVLASGGKMLRPRCLFVGSKMGKLSDKREDDLVQLATVIETMHLATLIHDDIIDEAALRRNRASVQAKYGQSYAVYMGDYLLTQCFLMLSRLEMERELGIQLAKTVQRICLGDMKQNQMRYNTALSIFQYIKIVSGKTAALFSIAMSAGAYHAKAKEEDVKLLGRIGYELGMAFQVVDDLLDFEGDSAVVGKEVQADIGRGYYSLPLLYVLEKKDAQAEALKKLLQEPVTKEHLARILSIIKDSGAIDKTRALALEYNKRAMVLVDRLPLGETKELLKEMVPPLLSRIH